MNELLFERIYLHELLLISSASLFLFCCIIWLSPSQRRGQLSVNCLLAWYVFSVLCYTVFCRKMGELTQFRPIPFYNLFDGIPFSQFIYEGLLNMVMFVPIGIGAALAKWNRWCIVGGALILSMTIEMMQWLLKCGCCEMNDVINNVLGCAIGIGLAQNFRRFVIYPNDRY